MSKGFVDSPSNLDSKLRLEIEVLQEQIAQYYAHFIKGNGSGVVGEDLIIQYGCDKAQELIERGANLNLTADNGSTLAHMAAFVGDIDLLRFLIE